LASYPIAKVTDAPPGSMIGAEVEGHRILLANVEGQFYVIGAVCNHRGGFLDRGKLEGSVVTCPLHGSKWDVRTGMLVQFVRPLPPEKTYKVVIEGDQVLVET